MNGAYDSICDRQHLLEQRLLLLVPTARVHDDHLEALLLEHLHTVLRNYHGVNFRVASVEGDPGLRGVLLDLIVGTSTEGIRAHKA